MSTEHPPLAEFLADHWPVHDPHGHINGTVPGSIAVYDCICGDVYNATLADCLQHQADAWREACTIRTAEQVLNLPVGVVLHSNNDGAIELFSDGHGHWYLPGRRDAIPFRRVLDNLPALLIWHPDWSQS